MSLTLKRIYEPAADDDTEHNEAVVLQRLIERRHGPT
jgi:hypothetical protein